MFRIINKQRNKKGFTLVELVVVIAILGILAAIAVPRLLGFQDRAREQADKQMAVQVKNALSLLMANGELDPPVPTAPATTATTNIEVSEGTTGIDVDAGALGATETELEGLLDELIADFNLQNTNAKIVLVTVNEGGAVAVALDETGGTFPTIP